MQNATIRNFSVESLTTIIHNSLAHTISNPLSASPQEVPQEALQEFAKPELGIHNTLNDKTTPTDSIPTQLHLSQSPNDTTAQNPTHTTTAQNTSSTGDTKPYPPLSLDGHQLSTQELHVDAMQVKMLEALTELSKNSHNDVKDKTLNAVDTLLQSSGQTLNSGY